MGIRELTPFSIEVARIRAIQPSGHKGDLSVKAEMELRQVCSLILDAIEHYSVEDINAELALNNVKIVEIKIESEVQHKAD